MAKELNYESGILGRAEVRFGGKIALDVVEWPGTGLHGITMAEFYEKGTVGSQPPTPGKHEPQVFLVFDNMRSVEILEQCLMTVRENLKRDAEREALPPQLPPETEALLSRRLTDCDLSVRTLNICKAGGIDTLRDLVRLRKTDWLKFRNGGKRSLAELSDFLQAYGLDWGMNVGEKRKED